MIQLVTYNYFQSIQPRTTFLAYLGGRFLQQPPLYLCCSTRRTCVAHMLSMLSSAARSPQPAPCCLLYGETRSLFAFVNCNIIYDAFIKSDKRDKRPHTITAGNKCPIPTPATATAPTLSLTPTLISDALRVCVCGPRRALPCCTRPKRQRAERQLQLGWLRVPDSCQLERRRCRQHFTPNGVNFLMSNG